MIIALLSTRADGKYLSYYLLSYKLDDADNVVFQNIFKKIYKLLKNLVAKDQLLPTYTWHMYF
jgi:hypothetical protein